MGASFEYLAVLNSLHWYKIYFIEKNREPQTDNREQLR